MRDFIFFAESKKELPWFYLYYIQKQMCEFESLSTATTHDPFTARLDRAAWSLDRPGQQTQHTNEASMSTIKVGINGFGRIGRQVFRILQAKFADRIEVVAINDLYDAETNFHLVRFDTEYGQAPFVPQVNGDTVKVNDWTVRCFKERDPAKLPWGECGVDVVIESTGVFRSAKEADIHRVNGAKKVIITAPAKDEDLTVVMGVNHEKYDPARHNLISNASCTTNCLAPFAKVVHDSFGIKSGLMTTVHSYTNDQRILDLPHKDLRRARAAACNIIPTSTGAAQAVGKVIPELKGRFTGYALRVPTPAVSIVDFVAELEKNTTTEELLAAFHAAAEGPMKGILGVSDLPLVSSDFKGDSRSSIIEAEYCSVQDGKLAKVVSWYDNEFGYASRVADLVDYMRVRGL